MIHKRKLDKYYAIIFYLLISIFFMVSTPAVATSYYDKQITIQFHKSTGSFTPQNVQQITRTIYERLSPAALGYLTANKGEQAFAFVTTPQRTILKIIVYVRTDVKKDTEK